MLIGLLSDTHIPETAGALPAELRDAFRGVQLILHAGDVYSPSVLDELEQIAPVRVAVGDDDESDVFFDPRMVEEPFTTQGVKILVKHVAPWFRSPPAADGEPMAVGVAHQMVGKNNWIPDIIVCGHTHKAGIVRRNGILIVNPGSLTFPNYEVRLGTVGILRVDAGKAEVHLVQL